METAIVKSLINNTALLIALGMVYEIDYLIHMRSRLLKDILRGVVVGSICIAIMYVPFVLEDGVIFDTRSILISVTGLFFGGIPTVIAMGTASAFRYLEGGAGALTGITVIAVSGTIGLLWRRLRLQKGKVGRRWSELYALGLVVHLAMLLCMNILPRETARAVLGAISLPVMSIYPVGTVLLGLMLFHQKDRNEAVVRVEESEERYRSLFRNNHAVMLILDPATGRIVESNPAASNYYGWSGEEMARMGIGEINTLEEEEIQREMGKALEEKRRHFNFRHRKADGTVADVEVYSGPISFQGKKHLYSIVHDVSEKAMAQRKFMESENRFRTLVDHAPDGIFIQRDGKFKYVNNAAMRFFKAEKEEDLLGGEVLLRFHPDSRASAARRNELLEGGGDPVTDVPEICLDLEEGVVHAEVSAVPVEFEEGKGAVVFLKDSTEKRALEEAKLQAESQLRQQQKLEAIGTLAGGVAHEINNPVNGIMNYAQLILDDLEDRERNRVYASEIILETERVAEIVQNLLQFSRQEKQSHSYARVEDIVHRTLGLVRTILKKDRIGLEVDLEEGLPEIKCRSQQIQQVLMNLLTNARDALNDRYPEGDERKVIRIRGSLSRREDRRWLRLDVEDTGNGIPDVDAGKVFEPFYTTKPKEKGTGLGLAISYGIVADHHGRLTFDSEEGLSTVFHLELPVDNGWDMGKEEGNA
ncbi:PAS domain S-box protein [Anaerotalea alkaliphila]|uniref:histidine kinase n=1 Tax=Anaerotalea alkaliphila TaxID=2662126 RepID=A0A7X5HUS6_9FIRM|nr:PAS domain S-box protein [Anaerotalea alkaliphila]NDL67020.1 PAS domain S-box protein [Anaerotalea alkaliphila]